MAPGYLCDLVVPYTPVRALSSADKCLLRVPPGKPGKYGVRSFIRSSASLWNALHEDNAESLKDSPDIESFKRNLKTYLYKEYFYITV